MALIKCEECGREISDRAAACPGCGAPVSSAKSRQKPAEEAPKTAEVYYVLVSEKEQGPYTIEQLAGLLHREEINSDTYYCQPGMEQWARMADMMDLLSLLNFRKERGSSAPQESPAGLITHLHRNEPESEHASLYRFATRTILAGLVQYAAPFHVLSEKVLKNTGEDFRTGGINSLQERGAECHCRGEFDGFLSNFFAFSAAFVEIVSGRLAETVRRRTNRPDIRMQTTASLATAIRKESFQEMESALRSYAEHAVSLGIALASTSTLEHSIAGAFVGGGLEFMLTDGEHSAVGAVAGAIFGGMAAATKKQELKQLAWDGAIDGVRRATIHVGSIPAKLMDQYVSYVFGQEADFELRDQESDYAQRIALDIANTCGELFNHAVSLLSRLGGLERLTVGGCDVFELASLPRKKREQASQIAGLLGNMGSWHGHLVELQSNCAAGIAS